MKSLILAVGLLFLGSSSYGQQASFYVSKRYQSHFAEGKTTGRSEVAFFALSITQKDSCLEIEQYRRIDQDRLLDTTFTKVETYCREVALDRFTTACQRGPSGGLFRHQHTEGQNWVRFNPTQDTVYLRRCGLARTENTFIKTTRQTYINQ